MATRLKTVLLAFVLCSLGLGQVWEKTFQPGFTLRVEVDPSVPRVVYAIRFHEASGSVKASASLPGATILADTPSKGRGTVSEAVAFHQALGGINADYFPFTGDPLGLMVRDGELLSHPNPTRSVIAWGDRGATFGKAVWKATATLPSGQVLEIDALNAQCGPGQTVLNTPPAGLATLKGKGALAVFKFGDVSWTPQTEAAGELTAVYSDVESLPIEPGTAVIVANGLKADLLRTLSPGDKVSVKIDVRGFDWTRRRWAIGGGPDLVRYGQINIDGKAQDFGDNHVNKRHPRTAVGRTLHGDVWYVVVDGRQKFSDGATLPEMATIMKRLGCIDAINLDGGGSSAINLFGLTLNKPSDGKERPVANAILFHGVVPPDEQAALTLTAAGSLVEGGNVQITLLDARNQKIPHAEIVWSAQGDGWIDQGGLVHGLKEGTVIVRAWARGRVSELSVPVLKKPKPPSEGQSRPGRTETRRSTRNRSS